MAAEELLARGTTRRRAAIVDFVARVTGEGPDLVPARERVATFDNDGTLWCEKPMPIQLGLHPAAARRDGRAGPVAARAAAVEGRAREGLRVARAAS